MAVNADAPVVASAEVEIAAPALVVWDLMASIDQWPTWNPDIKAANLDGPLAPGSRFRWRSGPGQITSTLQQVRLGELMEWTGSTLGIKAVHVWRIRPSGAGVIATTEESWEGLPVRLFRGRSRKTLGAAIESGLQRLKAEAERLAGDDR